nr:hypothetical protein [Ktedonobacteraceae bacterium]
MNRDFGDFQTPSTLVMAVLERLYASGKTWSRVLEPTCGRGNFVEGLLKLATPPCEIQALEIQEQHLLNVRRLAGYSLSTQIVVRQANIFDLDIHRHLQWNTTGPLLVVGNPPWVTNSELGMLNSTNLPQKTNIKKLKGMEARTGESNFDIAEHIWLKLMEELVEEQPFIALLCKTAVARNILQFAFDTNLPVAEAAMYMIDAKKWFGAAVDACLFCIQIGADKRVYEAPVYPNLHTTLPTSMLGIVGKQLVADVQTYTMVSAIDGVCPLVWRQGLKHDAASVMELNYDTIGKLKNKLGEIVNVESEYVYPLLKGSDVYHGLDKGLKRTVIVTQKRLGDDTYHLKYHAPQLWSYLTKHIKVFEQRKSSIYVNQPPFAIFGIGDYSFAPYKVSISGFHKQPRFRVIGPVEGKPVMLDDTCYFIPCYSVQDAVFLASLLNDSVCIDLINAVAFLDAKRPITKKLLQRIDLVSLFSLIDKQALLARANHEFEQLGIASEKDEVVWPSTIEEFLIGYLHRANYICATKDSTGVIEQLRWIS